MHKQLRILVVDLNNFARYPTLSVGIVVAAMREAGHRVDVFAPLMVGVSGVVREPSPRPWSAAVARWNHRIATSRSHFVRRTRERIAGRRRSGIRRQDRAVCAAAIERLRSVRPDVVLLSTYLMYRDVCTELCAEAAALGIPVLVGGPYFTQPEVIESWVRIPGVSALVAGEVELDLPEIVQTLARADDPARHPGLYRADPDGAARGSVGMPLHDLDRVPLPDYRDFPWQSYPNRIVSLVTGRGCGWGRCTFCSDITSTAGRTYRSRSLSNVLAEIELQHQRHAVSHFVFADLKLNSNVSLWRELPDAMRSRVPGSSWIGAVHVGAGADNGLSPEDLRAAAKGGCVRLTTGLETGSERVARAMHKGTSPERVGAFLEGATSAGISTRCTMVLGHPGETAADVAASADFLMRHGRVIERVSINRLQVVVGTALHRTLVDEPATVPGFSIRATDPVSANVELETAVLSDRDHRREVGRLLDAAHRINRRPLLRSAAAYEGVM